MTSKASRVPGVLDLTYQTAIRTMILIIGCVLLVVAVQDTLVNDIRIEPISVPKKLEEDGYSGMVVARLLLEEVQTIRQSADKLQIEGRDAAVKFLSEDQFAALATIQVPSSSLSLRSITDMLRNFFNIPERKIGGSITIKRPARPDEPPMYRVALVLGAAADIPAEPVDRANFEEAILLSARWIARQYDPVGLAAYYLDKNDLRAVKQLADDLMKSRDQQHRRASLFIRGLYEDELREKIALFQEVIADDPNFIGAYNALGSALSRAGKTDEAIAKFGEAIRINPSSPLAFRNRAVAYRDKGAHELAVADFERASKLKATADAFVDLGFAYEFLEKFDPATVIKAYDEAIRLDRLHLWALNNRCYMKAIRGDDSAIADCDRALLLKKFTEIYDSRGFAHLRLKQFDQAIIDYNDALERGQQAYSYFGRGVAKRRMGDIAGGDADIAEALKRDRGIAEKMAKFGVTP